MKTASVRGNKTIDLFCALEQDEREVKGNLMGPSQGETWLRFVNGVVNGVLRRVRRIAQPVPLTTPVISIQLTFDAKKP